VTTRSKPARARSGGGSTYGRKAYRSPKLVAYGDVRKLTDAAGNMNPNADGGGYLATKT